MTGLGTTLRERPESPDVPPEDIKGGYLALAIGLTALVVYSVSTDNGLYLVGALVFFVGLLVSVVLHEAGHFFTARAFGMKATQFFVGFGPTLWSRHRGETEYGIKAVPAGGFVKIIGMTPLEEVEPGDEDRAFFRFPAGKKTVVLAAGSFMHFVIALVLIFGSAIAFGAPAEVSPAVGAAPAQCIAPDPVLAAGTTVAQFNEQLRQQSTENPCAQPGAREAPAVAAGLRQGDIITAVDERAVNSGDELTTALRAGGDAGEAPLALSVRRGDERLQLTLTPIRIERQLSLTDRQTVGTVGILVQQRGDVVRGSVTENLDAGCGVLTNMAEGIKRTVTEKLPTVTKIFSDDRDPEGSIGVVGAGRISGEVLESDETMAFKVYGLITLVAGLNLFVGLFNLLPLLPLDGGHIAINWYESARDKIRRKRGYQGEIRRVDFNKLLPLTYAVAGLFAVFTVALIGADIFNPISINS